MILAAGHTAFRTRRIGRIDREDCQEAEMAKGTVFIYFPTKDDLINQLYLELKGQLRLACADLPHADDLRESLWHLWSAYVNWGLSHPVERQAMAKLQVSDRVRAAAQGFQDVIWLLVKAQALGGLRKRPTAFVGSPMVAMAEASIDLIASDRKLLKTANTDGFAALWRAIATS